MMSPATASSMDPQYAESTPAEDPERALVFLDIDGTLIGADQQLPASASQAIVEASRRGHKMFLCTGRSLPEIYPHLWQLPFDGVIAGGGGYARCAKEVLLDRRFSADTITQLNAVLRSIGALNMWQGPEAIYASDGFIDFFLSQINPGGDPGAWQSYGRLIQPFLHSGLPTSTSKATAYIPHSAVTFKDIEAMCPPGVRCVLGSVEVGSTLVVEFMPVGVSKGAAIEVIAQHLGAPMSRTIAVGDSHNDIEALQMAGCGVAMGGAPTEVVEAADIVTASVADDGIAQAFARLGLIGDRA